MSVYVSYEDITMSCRADPSRKASALMCVCVCDEGEQETGVCVCVCVCACVCTCVCAGGVSRKAATIFRADVRGNSRCNLRETLLPGKLCVCVCVCALVCVSECERVCVTDI